MSSAAANDYLRNNPDSPFTQSVSTALEAAGNLQKDAVGGMALLLDNKPLADAMITTGNSNVLKGQSIGTGPQDTQNWQTTQALVDAASGIEKLGVVAGRILDGTSGLGRQVIVELRQELPALFLGGGTARGIIAASGVIDTTETGGGEAINAYDDAVKAGKTHTQALEDARVAGVVAGGTEAVIQATLGKLADLSLGKFDDIIRKGVTADTTRVVGRTGSEGVVETVQEGGSSAAVDLALTGSVDVNKALTQGVLGGVVGGGTQTATAPVIVAEGHPATTAGTDASTAGGTTTAPTVGGTTTAPAGTTTTGVTETTAPAGTVETISQTDSAVDAANNVILNTNQTVTDALSSGADVSTTVSDAISNATSLGADANSVVSNVVATSLGAGADLDQVVSSAVNVSSNVSTGADLNLTLGNIVASAVNSGADITSVVNAVSNAAAAAGQNVSVDQIGNVVTIDNNRDGTRTVIYTDSNTVSSVNDLTGTRTEISTDAATNTQTTAVSDANTNTTTVVNNNTGATTQTVVDNNTGTTTETKTDPAAGTSTTTNVDNNTGVTTQTTVNNNTGVTTETVANNNTGVTTQTTVDNNTEVTTETVVDSNTNVTTETKTDSTNNTTTETVVDNNTGVTTQTTVDNNTGSTTETKVDNNTGVTTQTTVDNNTGVTTETVVDSNSNITTETKTDSNTNTSVVVVTDLNTNTQVTTVVDTDSGIITSQNIDVAPPEWEPPVIEPPVIEPPVVEPPVIEPPVVVDPPVIENPVIEPPVVEPPVVEPPVVEPPVVEPPVVKPPVVKPPVVEPPPPSPKMLLAGAPALGGFGPDIGRLAPTFLKSWETQKRIDPLAQFEKERREAEMIQQIDPRLFMMLQQRSQESEERPYYAYGQEESIDDILGNKEEEDVELKTGGYVAPLNKSMPLMSKAGGALSHYREDFRHGKHVAGKGDGQSDDIPAWLADSEFVLPADVVAALGNGSTKAGTNKLYEMMYAIRERARSTGPKDLPPPALKSPLDYLKSVKRSAK